MQRLRQAVVVSVILLTVSATRPAFGGGIEVINQGARGAGQAEAFAAQADDPSAIYYNPAGLTQLHGTQFTAGLYYLDPQIQFKGVSGNDESMYLPSLLPHLYAESDFGTDRWRFGIGFNNVFGLNEDWGDRGQLRTLSDSAHLYLFNIAPTIAYQVTDNISIAGEVNVYYGDFELRRNQLLGAPPIPEGHFTFRGHDVAVGATVGAMWKLDDRNTIAAVYRSPFSMDFDGHAQLTAPIIPKMGPSPADARAQFPQMVTLAYAVRPVKPLKLEADVVYTNWDTFGTVQLHSGNPAFNGTSLQEDWKDSFSYRFGAQYDLDEHWSVRAGYAYGTNAVPESTFSPLVPDGAYDLITLGVGYQTTNWNIDAAFQYIPRETRNISGSVNSPLVDGEWKNTMYGVMVTFTLKI